MHPPHQHQRRNIRHRPSTLRCNVKVQRIGANYDPIMFGKMDDLVSRIISVSMDLYLYYIPITVRNENTFNEFRVRVNALTRGLTPIDWALLIDRIWKKKDAIGNEEWKTEAILLILAPCLINNSLFASLNAFFTVSAEIQQIRVITNAAAYARSYLPRTQKRYIFFYVFSASVHTRHRDQRVEKKQSRITVYLYLSVTRPTYDGVFISYAKRWSIAHRGGEGPLGNVNRNILKRCLHGNN